MRTWPALLMPFLAASAFLCTAQRKTSPAAGAQASNAGETAIAKKAETARAADQNDEAIRLYRQLVQMKPESAEYWWYLGMLYYEQDQYVEGQAAFHHLTGLKPQMSLGWAMLGLCEFETKNYDRALVHLERADDLKIPSEHDFYDVARYHLALLMIRDGQFEAAVKVLVDFVQRGKEGPQFTVAMGLAGLRKALLPDEIPALEREMVLDVGQAMCDAAARRAADLDRDIAELIRKYPNTAQIHYLSGSMLLSGDPDRALEQWKAELTVAPNNALALVSIAQEYLKRGEYQTALPFAEKAVSANPTYFTAHAVLGQVLADGNLDIPRGIHELETAVRIAPAQPQVHFALGTAYIKAGRKQDAERERAEFLRLRGAN
jgi:tetratricopeptide (TPR) repeat protein